MAGATRGQHCDQWASCWDAGSAAGFAKLSSAIKGALEGWGVIPIRPHFENLIFLLSLI